MSAAVRNLLLSMSLCVIVLTDRAVSIADESSAYRVVIVSATERVLGEYRSYEAASKAALDWAEANPTNYALWRIDEIKGSSVSKGDESSLEELRQAVADAKMIFKKKPNGKTGSTLRDYQNAVRDAYKRARDAKTTLVKGVDGQLQKNMREINSLIKELNREADTYNAMARIEGFETIDRIAEVSPIQFQKPKTVDIAPIRESTSTKNAKPAKPLSGQTLQGKIGPYKAKIAFVDGAFTVSGDVEGSGTWKQNGSEVHMETASCVFRGSIDGDQIKGIRYFKDHRPYDEWGGGVSKSEQDGLIGIWQYNDHKGYYTIFRSDGTYSYIYGNRDSKRIQWRHDGTWERHGTLVTIRKNYSAQPRVDYDWNETSLIVLGDAGQRVPLVKFSADEQF